MPTFETSISYVLTSDNTWGNWTESTSATSVTQTWVGWTSATAIDTSVTQTWVGWTSATAIDATITIPAYTLPPQRQPTPEEIAAIERRQREWEAAELERKREASEAFQRAEALLDEHLSATQRRQLRESGWFEVAGSRGGVYRIHRGHAGNVRRPDIRRRYCIHPSDVPEPDTMLAQKLMLETDEEMFLQIANESVG